MTSSRPVSVVVIGDSIAFGQGAERPSLGLGPRLGDELTRAGTPNRVTVVAVPGARSESLAGQVRAASTARPDVAVVVIGANDVTHLVPAAHAAELLAQAVRTLRAQDVQVVVAPAPDLGTVPLVPVQLRAMAARASSALRQAQARVAIRAGARVVDVDALTRSFAADAGLYSADRFHPSSRGYALIARALLPAVSAAVAEAFGPDRYAG